MSTNWLQNYGSNSRTRKFQAGGEMAPPAAPAGPEAGGGGAPDLDGMLAEYAQTRDPQLAVQICDSLVELMAQQGGGGGAPAGGPPPPEGGGAPMGRNGLRMTQRGPIFKK